MKSSTQSSATRPFTARPGRAALSPLARRRAFALPVPAVHSGGSGAVRWWNPHVVDRLRAPLTRWHD
jgi:hypothetical protein